MSCSPPVVTCCSSKNGSAGSSLSSSHPSPKKSFVSRRPASGTGDASAARGAKAAAGVVVAARTKSTALPSDRCIFVDRDTRKDPTTSATGASTVLVESALPAACRSLLLSLVQALPSSYPLPGSAPRPHRTRRRAPSWAGEGARRIYLRARALSLSRSPRSCRSSGTGCARRRWSLGSCPGRGGGWCC